MINEEVKIKAKELDNEISNLRDRLEELEDERRALDRENVGCFMLVTADGNYDRWDEYYTPYLFVTEEYMKEKIKEETDNNHSYVSEEFLPYYYEINPDEYRFYEEVASIEDFLKNIDLSTDSKRYEMIESEIQSIHQSVCNEIGIFDFHFRCYFQSFMHTNHCVMNLDND